MLQSSAAKTSASCSPYWHSCPSALSFCVSILPHLSLPSFPLPPLLHSTTCVHAFIFPSKFPWASPSADLPDFASLRYCLFVLRGGRPFRSSFSQQKSKACGEVSASDLLHRLPCTYCHRNLASGPAKPLGFLERVWPLPQYPAVYLFIS